MVLFRYLIHEGSAPAFLYFLQNYFLKLFGYDKWATIRLLKIFDQKWATNPRINELLPHMQSVQRVWLDRFRGRKESVQRFQDRAQDIIWKDMRQCHEDWMAHIQSLQPADFDLSVTYNNLPGRSFNQHFKRDHYSANQP